MDRNVNYALLGAVVVALTAILILLVLWIAGTYDSRNFAQYTLYFDDAVSGLNEGGSVNYRGVRVGRVRDIRLAPDRADRIKVDIEVDPHTPVNQSSVAQLKPEGITGLSFIDLRTGRADAPPLEQPADEPYPVLKAEPFQLEKLIDDVPALAQQAMNVAEQLERLLDDENVARVERLLDSLNRASAGLESMPREVERIRASVQSTLQETERALATSTETLERLEPLAPSAQATLDELSAVTARVDALVRQSQPVMQQASEEALPELTRLIRTARQSLDAVEELARTLNETPSRLIYRPTEGRMELPP